MQLNPWWRRVALTTHITSSVGWFGAVVVFLVLAVLGFRSGNDQFIRAVYVALEAVGWFVIVPFSAASLLTGVVQSAGTKWGLVRHYWVLSKLLITVGASLLLLLHMQVMSTVAEAAAAGRLQAGHLRDPRMQLVGDAAAGRVMTGDDGRRGRRRDRRKHRHRLVQAAGFGKTLHGGQLPGLDRGNDDARGGGVDDN